MAGGCCHLGLRGAWGSAVCRHTSGEVSRLAGSSLAPRARSADSFGPSWGQLRPGSGFATFCSPRGCGLGWGPQALAAAGMETAGDWRRCAVGRAWSFSTVVRAEA
eukprot:5678560-Alexandrium_andersonii.AAC.1